MAELRGQPDLEEKPLRAKARRQFRVQHLEGDPAILPEILCQVHRSHSTAAELALERVAVGQGGLESFQGLDQIENRTGISLAYSQGRQRSSDTRRLLLFLLVSPGRSGHSGAGKWAPMLGK